MAASRTPVNVSKAPTTVFRASVASAISPVNCGLAVSASVKTPSAVSTATYSVLASRPPASVWASLAAADAVWASVASPKTVVNVPRAATAVFRAVVASAISPVTCGVAASAVVKVVCAASTAVYSVLASRPPAAV